MALGRDTQIFGAGTLAVNNEGEILVLLKSTEVLQLRSVGHVYTSGVFTE